jgi:hypothetical protein
MKSKYFSKKIIILLVSIGVAVVAIIASLFLLFSPKSSMNDYDRIDDDIMIDLKPVVYLYPNKQIDVNLELDFDGEVFVSYPEIADGWQVTAFPDGKIINKADGREYSYLFWEGMPRTERQYDWSKGFVVKGSEAREFLQKKLAEMGLTPKEYNEFIVYWYPKLMVNEYNLVHFANHEEYGQYAKLNITPKPNSELRVFMVFRKLDQPVAVEPQEFAPFNRAGFTVVEWGGSEIKTP